MLYESRDKIQEDLNSVFLDVPEGEEREYRVYPEFAWSAAYCLAGLYTMKYPDVYKRQTSLRTRDQRKAYRSGHLGLGT